MFDSHQLRINLRRQRRALSPAQQQQAAEQIAEHLVRSRWLLYSRRIAFYLASRGEIDPFIAQQFASDMGRQTALPVLHPNGSNRLLFAPADAPMAANRFGIQEPDLKVCEPIALWTLDIILVPLVAFDGSGNRLGMGKGYYDRTLARLHNRVRRPKLIGLAHHFQQVDALQPQPWDVPLDGVVTDREILRFSGRTRR